MNETQILIPGEAMLQVGDGSGAITMSSWNLRCSQIENHCFKKSQFGTFVSFFEDLKIISITELCIHMEHKSNAK